MTRETHRAGNPMANRKALKMLVSPRFVIVGALAFAAYAVASCGADASPGSDASPGESSGTGGGSTLHAGDGAPGSLGGGGGRTGAGVSPDERGGSTVASAGAGGSVANGGGPTAGGPSSDQGAGGALAGTAGRGAGGKAGIGGKMGTGGNGGVGKMGTGGSAGDAGRGSRGGDRNVGGAGGRTGSGGAAGAGGTTGSSGRAGSGGGSLGGGSGASGSVGRGGSTSGSSGQPCGASIPMTIPAPSNGSGEIRAQTTVLKAGDYDFENKKIGVKNTVGCDGEGQPAVLELEDGTTIHNLIVAGGDAGGNGIVCKGNCTLDHVYWEDVCEDAATNSKDGATMTIRSSIALNASDKVFQHNAKGGSKTVIIDSYISTFGKVWRSCGDCTNNGGPRHLVLNNVKIEDVKTCVAGANENYGDTVTITNLCIKGGWNSSKDSPKICQVYKAVTDHQGESSKLYDGASQWNTTTCKVSQSDIKSW